jgi:hypothetical protein
LARFFAVTVLALGIAGCTGSDQHPAASSAPGEVVELKTLDTLKAAFAEGKGSPRLLLLLSPT